MWKEMLRAGLGGSLWSPWCASQPEPWTTGQRRVLWAEKVEAGSRRDLSCPSLPESLCLVLRESPRGQPSCLPRGQRPHDSGPVQDLANVSVLTGLS